MQNTINIIIGCLTIVSVAGPIVIQLTRYIAAKTNNRHLLTLADRAEIIVSSLDKLEWSNDDKRDMAVKKLMYFSNELGIPLSPTQAVDYVNSAVYFMRETEKQNSGNLTTIDYVEDGDKIKVPSFGD